MKRERKFSFNGVDVKFDINLESLIEGVRENYKDKIKFLSELLKKREKYIRSLHNLLKDRESAMFIMIDAVQILRKANKFYGLTEKQYLLLTYMSSINMCTYVHATRYLRSIGQKKVTKHDTDALIDKGFIIKLNEKYWAATDEGKKIIDNVYNAFRQDYTYFANHKMRMRNHVEPKQKRNRKFTEEDLYERSMFYKKMMRPFWDGGYKVMPKDKKMRVDYVLKWIEKQKEGGLEVDGMYMRLVEKWSAADPQIPRALSK